MHVEITVTYRSTVDIGDLYPDTLKRALERGEDGDNIFEFGGVSSVETVEVVEIEPLA